MTKFVVTLSILLALPGIVWSVAASSVEQDGQLLVAQQAPPQQNLQTAEGELTAVDTQNMTVQLQTSEGEQMHFTYTDQTQVVSNDPPVAPGSIVRISYQDMGGSHVAVRIEELQSSAG